MSSTNNSFHSDNGQSTTGAQAPFDFKDLQAAIAPLSAAIRRKLNGHKEDIQAARRKVFDAIDDLVKQVDPAQKSTPSYTPPDLMNAYWERIQRRKEATTTGFDGLNKALSGGFEEDRLVVLLGAPGSGKTTLVNQISDHVAGGQHPVLYVTSEDTPHNLLAKTIARRASIPYSAVQRGYPDQAQAIDQAFRAYAMAYSARFLRYVDATQGISLDEMYRQAEKHFSGLADESKGTPVLVVDYLQRLSRCENLSVDARQSVTTYVERLASMAKDLHCTVILLSAMNRASGYTTNGSTISSAKESGDIEYTADVILAVGPLGEVGEVSPGVRRWQLRIDKNRQGETTYDAPVLLDWCGGYQRFSSADLDDSAGTHTDQQFDFLKGSNGNSGNSRKGRRNG